MSNDKRFIDNSPFSQKKTIEEFKKEYDSSFFHFDENGILSKDPGECPMCSGCGRGFIDAKIPDLDTEEGVKNLNLSKKRMRDYFEIHIQKEVDLELIQERNRIEEGVRSKYVSKKT